MPIGFMCAIRGVILGTKRPKYNKTLRATATTPTTSTTIGLLSACSNLLTKLETAAHGFFSFFFASTLSTAAFVVKVTMLSDARIP
jgi:hypothetical protein